MVVIGIIAIMMAAVLPVVSSLSKSSGRKGAVSNLITILDQARALALADGRNTYVAFATNKVPPALFAEYAYKSYAVFEDDASGNPRAIQVTKWQKLPAGISLRNETATLLATTPVTFKFTPGGTITPTLDCPYVQFAPTGAVEQPTTGLRLVVFEGFYQPPATETATARGADGQPVSDAILIARYTGRAAYVLK